MRVCRTDRENASFLRCPYHGWAYKNDGRLMTAAAEEHYEEGELDKEQLGLIPVAQLGSYQGLIFATWDAEAPSLDDFLGDMKYYLDIIVGRTGGVEVLGPPQVWDVETGWKYATDNFTDNFHVFSAHHSLVELGMLPNDPDFAAHGHMIVAEEGHILHLTPARRTSTTRTWACRRSCARRCRSTSIPTRSRWPARPPTPPAPCGRTSTGCS